VRILKQLVRVLGIDDGPFKFSDEFVPIVGVVMRGGYLDGVMRSQVKVDGDEATSVVIDIINRSRYKEQVRVLMLNGIALGGFNVVDLEEVNKKTGIPCISITRDRPDYKAMEKVLKTKFDDWERRWAIIGHDDLMTVDTGHKPLYVRAHGIDDNEAKRFIVRSILRGALPEPLRIAHIIATALVKGESRGDA
jgi:endonuclease V-like protein UPF0215 family